MKEIIADAVIALLLVLLGFVGGFSTSSHYSENGLAAAQANLAVITSADKAKQASIEKITARLNDLQIRHTQVLVAGQTALGERDATIQKLRSAANRQRSAIAEKSHDTDCAALDRVALCPRIARELWPDLAAPGNDAVGSH